MIASVGPLLRQSEAGRAVFLTSGAASKCKPYWGIYSVSKAALDALARTWAAECENPDELTFAIIPTEETVAELQLYQPITDRMAKLTGKKIQFFMPTSYASVVEGLLSKFIDVAVLGPYSYVIANDKDKNIEVFATYAKRPGHLQEEGPGYKAALVTKKGSKFVSECGIREDTFVVSPVGRRNTLKLGDSKGDAYDFSSVLAKEESPLKKWLKQGKYTY